MKRLISIIIASFLFSSTPSVAVEFGQDASGDPNAVHIQGNVSGFLYSERIILTAAHTLNQLKIQPNGDTEGFVYAPGLTDKVNAKRYRIVKAFIPKTYINSEPSRGIQPIDDFAVIIINEDMPFKMKVKIANEDQMKRFAQNKSKVEMVGYGLQNGSQRNNPQELKRSPHRLIGTLYSPKMMIDHYNQYQLRPLFWKSIEWGVNTNQKTGTTCSGDSGSGFFVEENSIRYYVGTAGNGIGNSNCKADGTYNLSPGGAMSWFSAAYKFLDLIESAETFVSKERHEEFIKAEEVRLAAELRAKQEAEVRANNEEELRSKQEAEEKAKAELEEKAKTESELKIALENNQDLARKLYAGKKCTKLKSNKIIYGIKFTCIKKNKKLVWNRGI